MVARNAHVHFIYFQVRVGSITIFQRSFNGFNRFVDVQHLSMLHTVAIGTAKSKYFQFAEFILSPGNHCNLGCSDVKTDNNGLFVVHSMLFLVVCMLVPIAIGTDFWFLVAGCWLLVLFSFLI